MKYWLGISMRMQSKYLKTVNLFTRQRDLPFGAKLQNHALNQRMNQEFKKLKDVLDEVEKGGINDVLNEIIKQSKVEFNYYEDTNT